MNPKQKVIVSQIQIALAGVIILVFGLFWKNLLLALFGGAIIVYALARLAMMLFLMKDDSSDAAGGTDWQKALDEQMDDPSGKDKDKAHSLLSAMLFDAMDHGEEDEDD